MGVKTPSSLTLEGVNSEICVPSGNEHQVPGAVTSLTFHSLLAAHTPCFTSPLSYTCIWGSPPNKPSALELLSQGLLLGSPDQDSRLLVCNFRQVIQPFWAECSGKNSSELVTEFSCGLDVWPCGRCPRQLLTPQACVCVEDSSTSDSSLLT